MISLMTPSAETGKSDVAICSEKRHNLLKYSSKNKEKPPLWDSFQDPPSKKATGSAASWNKLGIILKLFKLFTYIFVFITVLVTAIASKISFIFMVAQVQPHRSLKYCNIVGMYVHLCRIKIFGLKQPTELDKKSIEYSQIACEFSHKKNVAYPHSCTVCSSPLTHLYVQVHIQIF